MSDNKNEVMNNFASAIGSVQANAPSAFLPEDAPFNAEQRHWLNGLLTGLHAIASAAGNDGEQEQPGTPMTILYGSQSGNGEALAKDLRKYAKTQGFEATISELDAVELADLSQLQHLLVICSTFGEGEPPDNAKSFYNAIMGESAADLPNTLNYSVCGLGDSSYAFFNKCAKDIDERLESLGAHRVAAFQECDVAFEDDYAEWKTASFAAPEFASAAGATGAAVIEEQGPKYDKNNPFIASLMVSDNLSHEDSVKTVNHIEISLAGGAEELNYEVGDALGVWPVNCNGEVDALLQSANFSGKENVSLKSGPASLRAALLTKLDLAVANANTFETWGIEATNSDDQIIDILSNVKPSLTAQQFVDGLRPLQPRLYSIASSPKAHPGEVHLTVGEVHYSLHDSSRKGVASTYLGDRLSIGGNIGVYLQRSAHFHIPADDSAPLIMIGPGTGIAPFRAFLEEREAREATGDNWLFFGDQHESKDYLYRDEIESWSNTGLLNNLSLAWSRDTDKKVYVQTKLKEKAEEFFQWLERGAYIYICGDASRMASDVDNALREVIAEQGELNEQQVQDYMDKLVKEHRYQRDVY